MISDRQTNTVYISEKTKLHFPKFVSQLEDYVTSHKYSFKILIETRDYFCRDYMPIQVDKKDFVQFIFNPSYYCSHNNSKYKLKSTSLTNQVLAVLENKIIKPKYSKIILDGGNVVKSSQKVILTNKVIEDNSYQFKNINAIINELESIFQSEIIIIPKYPEQFESTGHADGLVRFINEKQVFINRVNQNQQVDLELYDKLTKLLLSKNLDIIELPFYDSGNESAEGLYINYLQVGTFVVFPKFNNDIFDKEAEKVFIQIFGSDNVVGINSGGLAKYGGVLNCATWTIYDSQ
ncbi:MAG: agmatine deiminase family protein [Spirochaetes bacterium]|nr:agmatine deiminase family protein [Spirochaetota bacterium]